VGYPDDVLAGLPGLGLVGFLSLVALDLSSALKRKGEGDKRDSEIPDDHRRFSVVARVRHRELGTKENTTGELDGAALSPQA
jgi:hypothetical protein